MFVVYCWLLSVVNWCCVLLFNFVRCMVLRVVDLRFSSSMIGLGGRLLYAIVGCGGCLLLLVVVC